jgi:hypothetical protein
MAKAWNELSIKVAAPFAGISDLGFTAQYRSQGLHERLHDVPFLIEGPQRPLQVLTGYLQMLGEERDGTHAWSEPMMLSDEVVVMALKDRSLDLDEEAGAADAQMRNYVFNLARPAVFTFLQDCARVAHLRLSEVIEMQINAYAAGRWPMVFSAHEIVPSNGTKLLWHLV